MDQLNLFIGLLIVFISGLSIAGWEGGKALWGFIICLLDKFWNSRDKQSN